MRHERLAAIFFLVVAIVGPPATGQDFPDPAPPSSEQPSAGPDLSRFLPREDFERDGVRTLGAFPKNLGRSFVGVFSKDSLAPFVAGAAATGAAFIVDSHAQASLNGHAGGMSHVASSAGGGTYVVPATLGLFLAGRFAEGSRFRAFSYDATQAIIVSGVYSEAFKRIASRPRPDGSDERSFPSGHTSTAFAWATVAQAHYGWWAGAPSYLAATAIGFSRITNNKHNLSDVVAGATIGIITGRTVVRTNGEPTGRKRTFNLQPMTDANGSGVGLGATISW